MDEAVNYFGSEPPLIKPDLIRNSGKIKIHILKKPTYGKYLYFEADDASPVIIAPWG